MGLETGTYIDDLDAAWPLGTDPKSQGDDHLRLIKSVLKNTFPNQDSVFTAETLLRNYIDGCITENGTDPTKDIIINSGEAMDSTNLAMLKLLAPISKDIAAVWAEGDTLGGFPSNLTLTNDTWYHLFIIAKTDGTIDAGWDTDLAATNLLLDATGYTLFKRIASNLYATATIQAYTQYGDHFDWVTLVTDSTTNITLTESTIVLTVPLGIEVIARLNFSITKTTGTFGYLYAMNEVPGTISQNNCHLRAGAAGDASNNQVEVRTNELQQIHGKAGTSTPSSTQISTQGWQDFRGKQ